MTEPVPLVVPPVPTEIEVAGDLQAALAQIVLELQAIVAALRDQPAPPEPPPPLVLK
jgi:hypothetical protein